MRPHKRFNVKFWITLPCLVAMLLLASCGTSGGSPNTSNKPKKAPDSQQVYRSPLVGGDISTFDPGQATDLASIAAIDMVFTGLVTLNDQLQVVPQLAHDYMASPDGLTWTFHLKPNLKFSDGTPLTSADVAWSIDRALSPAVSNLNGVSLTYLGQIKGAADRTTGKLASIIGTGIETPDASTVVIHVAAKTAYFLETLTYSTAYVVEKSVVTQWGDIKWGDHLSDNGGQGGDGPFKVQSYDHNTGITFIPNPNYEGRHPQLKSVTFPFIKDVGTNYLEYQSGQVDNSSIPTANLAQARALPNKQFHQVPLLAINYYGLNYLVKPFDNIKIRQALDLAINKDVIMKSVWGGKFVASNHIVPSGMPGYDAGLLGPDGTANTSGNPDKAKALFAAGLQEEGMTLATFPTIKFTYGNANPDTAKEVTSVIQMWNTVLGITTIKNDPVEASTLFKEISNTTNNKSLALWKVNWYADYPDPQDWLTLQFDKGSAENNMNYGQNTSTDAATQQALQPQMEAADTNLDQTSRMKAYNQIEQQLINDVAWLPMDQVSNNYLLKPYVIGVIDNAQDLTPPDDWADIYIAVH